MLTLPKELHGLRAMVVDDDDFILEVVEETLRAFGLHDVLRASSGTDALQLLDKLDRPVEVLICDLNMERIDGVEILRHLATRGFEAGIIVLSGSDARILDSVKSLAREHNLRLLGVLGKPLDVDRLHSMLMRLKAPSEIETAEQRSANSADLEYGELFDGMESGCMTTVYQPVFSLREQKITGAESLLRWNDAKHGTIRPERVVAAAERHGLIGRLTVFVLRDAMRVLTSWAAQAPEMGMSVNLSSQSIEDLLLPEMLLQVVRTEGIDPRRVTFEMTETGLTGDTANSMEVINRLSLRGFRLSIDDFGVGQSNMQKLKNMPFSELKVDKGFVHDARERQVARAIVESSVKLAHSIGLEVVAEGTETQQDLDFVIKSGCDYIQGNAIAKPMPAASFLMWKSIWEAGHATGQSGLMNRI